MIGSIMVKSWEYVKQHLTAVTIVAILLIILAGYGVSFVKTDVTAFSFANKNSEEGKRIDVLANSFGTDALVVFVVADPKDPHPMDTLLSEANLKAYAYCQQEISKIPELLYITTPAFYIGMTLQNPATPKDVPLKDLILDSKTGQINPAFAGAFINSQVAYFSTTFKGMPPQPVEKRVVNHIKEITKAAGFEGNVKVTTAGQPVWYIAVAKQINTALVRCMSVALILMLIILAILLRLRGSFLWRWLTLAVVLVAVLYTFGIAGALDFKTTFVSMAMFPILLGLGVDYAIQFQNRYEEESLKGETADEGIRHTFMHVGPPIFIAIIVTVLAFLAMRISGTPMIRSFGSMLAIGIIVSFVVATLLLMSILYRRDRNKKPVTAEEAAKTSVGILERQLRKVTPLLNKYAVIIIPVFLALTIAGWAVDHRIPTTNAGDSYVNKNTKDMKEYGLLTTYFGGTIPFDIVVEADDVTDPEVINYVMAKEAEILQTYSPKTSGAGHVVLSCTSLGDVISGFGTLPDTKEGMNNLLAMLPDTLKRNFITPDHKKLHILVMTSTIEASSLGPLGKGLRTEVFANPPASVDKVLVTGSTMDIAVLLDKNLNDARNRITYVGIGLIFVALLVLMKLRIFRIISALLPIVLILGWSSGIMYLLGLKITIFMATMPAQIVAIGTEFTLLILYRYYEERDKGEGPDEAMSIAMTKIGRAILVSGLTVAGGFAALITATNLPILSNFGVMTVIDVLLCLVSSLLVMPAIVLWFDKRFRKDKDAFPSKA
ncbi:MAG: MMPL family transporter [Dehalococcoidia bacterium]|nr:MMPL family transporter [Dehalococcoidia bacterium]